MYTRFVTLMLPVLLALGLAAFGQRPNISASQSPRAAVQAADPVRDWIRLNAIPLATPEAGHGFSDMQPLKQIIGKARIVSLGEATHGTREFFQLKHRMLEFLASEMGFNIFSIEANMPEAYRLNDYVLRGDGDPAKLLKGMYFWTWDTEEVLGMVHWIREFNQSGKGRVQFTGFDMQFVKVPIENVQAFTGKYDLDFAATIQEAIRAAQNAGHASPPSGSMIGAFPVAEAAGRRVKFSGYLRTEHVTEYAGLWWRNEGPAGVLNFANLGTQAPKGTTGWKRYELEITVPKEATNINFGLMLSGGGAIWLDDPTVELDGQLYEKSGVFQFLENPVFYEGYQALRDLELRRGAGSSLQFRKTPGSNDGTAAAAATAWTRIVQHLEDSRKAYSEKNVSATEIDWAIQNARVVLQSTKMRANLVKRDQSMAENVKWILDHNPGAKIVLWAHNGHVNGPSANAGQTMGVALRKIYHDQMVVFGFAFNQGSFQAVEPGKQLRDFTVAPASEASLDTVLASTGIPIFALDLRRVPAEGPVAEWFKSHKKTRNIGAQYSEATASNYMVNMVVPERFDAMLFVEKTTAARKNPPVRQGPAPQAPQGYDAVANEYRDPDYSVSVKLAPGWKVLAANRWGDQATTVALTGPGPGAVASLYFQIPHESQPLTVEEQQQKLRSGIEPKVGQRLKEGFQNYRVRPDSIQPRTILGRQALSCIADFDASGKAMGEYLTWIYSEKATALFFARTVADRMEEFRQSVDPIIETIQIP